MNSVDKTMQINKLITCVWPLIPCVMPFITVLSKKKKKKPKDIVFSRVACHVLIKIYENQ